MELMSGSNPKLEVSEPDPIRFVRDQAVQSTPSASSELRSLAEELQRYDHGHRCEYADDLLGSLDAFERVALPVTPLKVPVSRECLLNYRRWLQEYHDEIWREITANLVPARQCTWRTISSLTLWPSIMPYSILTFLSAAKFNSLLPCWQQQLVLFGKAILSLRRCERLINLVDRRDVVGFFKEGEHIGAEGWDTITNPEWLLLEIENDMTIRKHQAEVAHQMITPELLGNAVLQLNMGEGKTLVITPMVASALADRKQLLCVIVLKPLLPQSMNLLSQRLGGLMHRRLYHVPFSRNTPIDPITVDELRSIYQACQKDGGILVCLPEQMLSFCLVGLDMIERNPPLANGLIDLEQWLQRHC